MLLQQYFTYFYPPRNSESHKFFIIRLHGRYGAEIPIFIRPWQGYRKSIPAEYKSRHRICQMSEVRILSSEFCFLFSVIRLLFSVLFTSETLLSPYVIEASELRQDKVIHKNFLQNNLIASNTLSCFSDFDIKDSRDISTCIHGNSAACLRII